VGVGLDDEFFGVVAVLGVGVGGFVDDFVVDLAHWVFSRVRGYQVGKWGAGAPGPLPLLLLGVIPG